MVGQHWPALHISWNITNSIYAHKLCKFTIVIVIQPHWSWFWLGPNYCHTKLESFPSICLYINLLYNTSNDAILVPCTNMKTLANVASSWFQEPGIVWPPRESATSLGAISIRPKACCTCLHSHWWAMLTSTSSLRMIKKLHWYFCVLLFLLVKAKEPGKSWQEEVKKPQIPKASLSTQWSLNFRAKKSDKDTLRYLGE